MHKKEDAAIKKRNDEKAAAMVRHEELKELQGLVSTSPTGERCVALMAKHGFQGQRFALSCAICAQHSLICRLS